MYFSTYKRYLYGGNVALAILLTLFFFGSGSPLGLSIVASVLLALLLVPLQFWRFSQLQDRLDEHDGRIPLWGAYFEDLEDDGVNSAVGRRSGSLAPPEPPVSPHYCLSCGRWTEDPEARICSSCGASLLITREATDPRIP